MKVKMRRNGIKKIFGFRILVLGFLIFLPAASYSQTASPENDVLTIAQRENLVREFVAAFNAHDSRRMLEMTDENIQWISVDGASSALEAEGTKALGKNMDSYFKRCTTCKSTLEWIQSTGNRILTLERAEWTGKAGLKSQKSLSVYEFRNSKILRVYYFPVEFGLQ